MTAEKEILLNEAYHAFYKAGFIDNHAPLDILEKIVSADFMGYGTAKDEKVDSINQLKQMITRQRQQSGNIDMQFTILPVFRRYTAEENTAVYVDELTITLNTADTSFQFAVRFTAVFEYEEKKWKVIHMHASVPGQNEGETDTWGMNEWKRKNAELEKLVAEKTADLEIKNRELEIEAALERVRAAANAMQGGNDLTGVITIVGQQLEQLGLQFDSTNFRVNVGEKDWDLWIYAKWMDAPRRWYIPYIDHPFFTIKEIEGEVSSMVFSNDEWNSFNAYLFRLGLIEKDPADAEIAASQKEYFDAGKGFAWSIALGKKVSLNIANSQAKPYTEEENALLMRFTIAFEQAYTRFLDLQKAEAQSREAQIELGLERVRARAMSMHKSSELLNAGELLYKELFKLGIVSMTCGYVLMDEEEKIGWIYAASPADGTILPKPTGLPHTSEVMRSIKASWKKQEPSHVIELDPQATIEHHTYLAKNSIDFLFTLEEFLAITPEKVVMHSFNFRQGYLLVVSNERLTPGQEEMVVRFTKVFEMTYRRFLDLQKAEAQSKEAQIELGLERVRARAMAMRQSNELAELVDTVFKELTKLHFSLNRCQIIIMGSDGTSSRNWMANPEIDKTPNSYLLKMNDHPYFQAHIKTWKARLPKWIYNLKGEEKDELVKYVFTETEFHYLPEMVKQGMINTRNIYFNSSYNNFGSLQVDTLQPLSDENLDILNRFGKVFDLTYTRFNDLQKAEAQTREAQIELGLERVRARAMAMQNSEELKELIGTVFTELTKLDVVLARCLIMIYDPGTKGSMWWMANSEAQQEPIGLFVQYHEQPPYLAYLEAWHDHVIRWQYELHGQIKKDWDDYLFVETELSKLPDFVIAGMKAPERVWLSSSFNNFGNLTLASLEPLSDEHFNIMLRFAKVFDLTYTRFNDLQKAEAQAREAQIELALERVRAKMMAIQHPDEFSEVIYVIGEQFLNLGLDIDWANFSANEHEFTKGFDLWNFAYYTDSFKLAGRIFIPWADIPVFEELLSGMAECKTNGSSFYTRNLSCEARNSFLDHIAANTNYKEVPDEYRQPYYARPGGFISSTVIVKDSWIAIGKYDDKPFSDDQNAILMRFGNAFDQAYSRFLDLQKAEAQAREAQIEAALERVRSTSMAMHKSDELADLSFELVKQVHSLGVNTWFCAFNIYDEDQQNSLEWGSNTEGTYPSYKTPREGMFLRYYEAGQKGETLHIHKIEKNESAAHYDYLCSLPGIGDQLLKIKASGISFPDTQIDHVAYFKYGYVLFITFEPAIEAHDIFKRFAKVFEQTYTRFLDLQKAEAQTREAQIETGLERVRYSAMAMQSSEDVSSATAVMFNEISLLGVEAMRCGITIIHPDKTADVWAATTTSEGKEMKGMGKINFNDHPLWTGLFDAWTNDKENFTYALKGDDLKSYYKALANSPGYNSSYIQGQEFSDHFFYACFFEQGAVFTFSWQLHEEEKRNVLKRFTAVFSLTFRRFLDLKQAEAQARESQIEASLERVRARTMAMHKSNDLLNVISVLSEQFQLLGFKIDSANFNTSYKEKDWNLWLYNPGTPLYPDQIRIPYIDHPYFNRTLEGLAQGKDFNAFVFSKEEKDSFLDHLYNSTIAKNHVSEERKKYCYEKPGFAWSVVYLENTCITIANYDAEPYTEEQDFILRRFGNVFEQSYRRFLDLQKAEAQTREAEIQLALERVRARTMAMQRSEELAETCELLFAEFTKLRMVKADQQGTEDRATIGIFNEADNTYDLWITDIDGKKIERTYKHKLDEPINISKAYTAWKAGKPSLVVDMHGDELDKWLDYLQSIGIPVNTAMYHKRRVNTWVFFSKGNLGLTTNEPLPKESLQLLQRFADTFNLTYTRFQDLKDAEIRTQIAVKEASLDRVRAEIASMRTAEDLQHITPLVWRELTALGVPFFRCGVFIVDDEKQKIHFYLSAPDGKPLAALELDIEGTVITKNATIHWREQKVYLTHWSKEEFRQFAQNLFSQGQIQNVNTYQGGEEAPESLSLQFVPFAQGMMYVGTAENLSSAQIELVQSLADAFSTAYARYEDFNKLETAKQQIESTLKDLRATQTQLIQSEKMASLGELTAGIAHEIQNPLNFVNNFSEVSTELVDEMNDEIQKGNMEDAKQISQDLKENLEKINHHGKRAGDIVRSMLQHSRSSSGVKEPTDINALADEYLRLAYHGLRAKDKSFNATMITDYDDSIGMINVIPQDIGRVILNLITNAFYAVNAPQPPKAGRNIAAKKYEPTVTVSTGITIPPLGGREVMISVKDNGAGIPPKILDKIFQPFFTTKPTGQGTGLGLSLSYDIVNAHGGQLQVETKQGEGTTFTILLPNHSS